MHAYLINSVFNFTEESCSRCEGFRNERDSARRKTQTLEIEIQVLKKKSEEYQQMNQALQKRLQRVKEELRDLQQFSEYLQAAKKEQQEKKGQLQRKNKELENKVTKKTSEFEKILTPEKRRLRKKVEDRVKKSLAETETKDVELENMSVQNKPFNEESHAVRSKCDELGAEVKRLRLRLRKMQERKRFV